MSLRHRPASRTTTRAAGASVAGLMLLGTALLATPAAADPATSWEDAAFRGSVQVVRGDDGTPEVLCGSPQIVEGFSYAASRSGAAVFS